MKAKRGGMQQKSRPQTSCSADECVMYVTWQLEHGAPQQRGTQDLSAELGWHRALQTVHSSVGGVIRRQASVPFGFNSGTESHS